MEELEWGEEIKKYEIASSRFRGGRNDRKVLGPVIASHAVPKQSHCMTPAKAYEGRIMSHKIFKTTWSLIFLVALFFFWNVSLSAQSDDAPIIHVDKTNHTFSPVFEGEELSHTFTVFNKGKAALHIKKVTHS
jgi:hypothetical protein